jgi:hydrogenase maturation factor
MKERSATGKVPPWILERCIFPYLGARRSEVIVRAGLGEDAAVFDPDGLLVAVSTDPITAAGKRMGWYAAHVALNDVAAGGARPLGLLATIILPPGHAPASLAELQRDLAEAAAGTGVEVLGGHTEFSDAVTRPIIVATGIGLIPRGARRGSAGGKPGDGLVLTKTAGLEGTAILASDYPDRLAGILSLAAMETARAMLAQISVVPEALLAADNGATAMHDVTEGGVVGAAWEMARASRTGFRLDRDRVPVAPVTATLAAALHFDPTRLIASGSLLIATPEPDGMVRVLAGAGIDASVIGALTPSGYRITGGDADYELPPDFSPDDELFRLVAGWHG